MATGADKYVAFLERLANNPDARDEYVWGAEGERDRDKDGYPEADCSGLIHAARVAAGIADSRTTANGYMQRAHKIAAPSEIGDFRVHLDGTGHAVHIIPYVGNGRTIEAKGAAYGIVRDTVIGGHGPWYRDDAVNRALGNVKSPISTTPRTRPVLRKGSKGNDVADVQRALGRIAIDGDFGPITDAAVRLFQKQYGLEVDGIVGPLTYKALGL